jgi:flagellar hook-length control protein FliK
VAPLAEPSASVMRSLRREPAAVSLPLVASANEAGAAGESVASPAWQLPAASSTGPSSGAAATASPSAHGAPVDTRSPNWHEAFAGRVQWLVDQHVGEARIKLNPPELGAVDVKISLVDDKTYVQLTAGSAAARDEIANSLPRLRELMTASGLQFGGASVHGGHAGHDGRGGHEPTARGNPFAALEPGFEDVRPLQSLRRMAGGVDTFA